jgi:hypothetical protein
MKTDCPAGMPGGPLRLGPQRLPVTRSLLFESGMKSANFILIPGDETSKQFPATGNIKPVTSNQQRGTILCQSLNTKL